MRPTCLLVLWFGCAAPLAAQLPAIPAPAVASFGWGTEYLFRTLATVAARSPTRASRLNARPLFST
jgi:hypothetical protein